MNRHRKSIHGITKLLNNCSCGDIAANANAAGKALYDAGGVFELGFICSVLLADLKIVGGLRNKAAVRIAKEVLEDMTGSSDVSEVLREEIA